MIIFGKVSGLYKWLLGRLHSILFCKLLLNAHHLVGDKFTVHNKFVEAARNFTWNHENVITCWTFPALHFWQPKFALNDRSTFKAQSNAFNSTKKNSRATLLKKRRWLQYWVVLQPLLKCVIASASNRYKFVDISVTCNTSITYFAYYIVFKVKVTKLKQPIFKCAKLLKRVWNKVS